MDSNGVLSSVRGAPSSALAEGEAWAGGVIATGSGSAEGTGGVAREPPTSLRRPVPRAAAVPAKRAVFLRKSRRRWYSASGVISALGGSFGRRLMQRYYARGARRLRAIAEAPAEPLANASRVRWTAPRTAPDAANRPSQGHD